MNNKFKLIIAGGRDIKITPSRIKSLINALICVEIRDLEIVHGGCPTGVDLAANYLKDLHWIGSGLKTTIFKADWKKFGKSAGPIRNREMAKYADHLLLVWDGKSKGSASMLKMAEKEELGITQIILNDYSSWNDLKWSHDEFVYWVSRLKKDDENG